MQQPHASELREHPFDEHTTNDEQQIIQCRNGKNSLKSDYLKLATAIDRIAFLCYLFLFTLFAIAYSIWKLNKLKSTFLIVGFNVQPVYVR